MVVLNTGTKLKYGCINGIRQQGLAIELIYELQLMRIRTYVAERLKVLQCEYIFGH